MQNTATTELSKKAYYTIIETTGHKLQTIDFSSISKKDAKGASASIDGGKKDAKKKGGAAEGQEESKNIQADAGKIQ